MSVNFSVDKADFKSFTLNDRTVHLMLRGNNKWQCVAIYIMPGVGSAHIERATLPLDEAIEWAKTVSFYYRNNYGATPEYDDAGLINDNWTKIA
jgi:hypothetical protein